MIKFEDLQFMSIGSNCVYLACFDRKTRLKGPLDNVQLRGVNALKLLINNQLYDFVKDTLPIKRKKEANEFRKGDCEIETIFPNKTISFIHNMPEGEAFLTEFKARCNRLIEFIDKVRTNDNCWLIFTLNQTSVRHHTGELVDNNLKEILTYIKELGLLNKTLIIGSRVLTINYKVFDYHLNRNSFNIIKTDFKHLNYIELNDVSAWEPEDTIKQFKEKIPKFIEAILARKE